MYQRKRDLITKKSESSFFVIRFRALILDRQNKAWLASGKQKSQKRVRIHPTPMLGEQNSLKTNLDR